MFLNLHHETEGRILHISDNVLAPEDQSWVDVQVGSEIKRLLVSQEFVEEHDLHEGQMFSWGSWSIPLIDILVNPVLDVTREPHQ